MILIGITGRLEAGKSTAARHLRTAHGFVGTALTDPMDEMAAPLLRRMGIPEDEVVRRLVGDMKNAPIPEFPWLSARKLKQSIGFDFRDAVSRPLPRGGTDRRLFQDLWYRDNADAERLVHEQIRYDFEADGVRDRGGIVIEVFDPVSPTDDDHPSERIDFPVDVRVPNPKTGLAPLHAALDGIVADMLAGRAG